MLSGFLEDTAFHSSNIEVLGDVGYLPQNYTEYFSDMKIIDDPRSERLTLTFHQQQFSQDQFNDYIVNEIYSDILTQYLINPQDTKNTVLLQILYTDLLGTLQMNVPNDGETFKIDRSYIQKLYYDNVTLEESDKWYLSSMSSQEIECLFNIIERVFVGSTYQQDINQLDNELTNNTTLYNGYKQGSLQITYHWRLAHIYDSNLDFNILVPAWIQFTLYKSGGYEITFKIWISRVYFEREYPFTVISAIIPPADCNTLYNLGQLDNPQDALNKSRDILTDILGPLIGPTKSYSGLLEYSADYHDPATSNIYPTTFVILYRGIIPSNTVIKSAIRNYLLTECTIGNEIEWSARYPTIFTDNTHYIYPIWDEKFTINDKTQFKSVIPILKINQVLTKVGSANTSADTANYEIMEVTYKPIITTACRDKDNQDESIISTIFPDYTNIGTMDNLFNMLNVNTRNFILLLNKALAAANGESNELSNTFVTINEYKYIKFTLQFREFLVQDKNSYSIMMQL